MHKMLLCTVNMYLLIVQRLKNISGMFSFTFQSISKIVLLLAINIALKPCSRAVVSENVWSMARYKNLPTLKSCVYKQSMIVVGSQKSQNVAPSV